MIITELTKDDVQSMTKAEVDEAWELIWKRHCAELRETGAGGRRFTEGENALLDRYLQLHPEMLGR